MSNFTPEQIDAAIAQAQEINDKGGFINPTCLLAIIKQLRESVSRHAQGISSMQGANKYAREMESQRYRALERENTRLEDELETARYVESQAKRQWDAEIAKLHDPSLVDIAAKAVADAVGNGQREKYRDIMEIGLRAAFAEATK